jgi:hypothetical protein
MTYSSRYKKINKLEKDNSMARSLSSNLLLITGIKPRERLGSIASAGFIQEF